MIVTKFELLKNNNSNIRVSLWLVIEDAYVCMYVRNVSELFVSQKYGLRFTTSTKGRNYNYKEEKQRQKTQIGLSLFMIWSFTSLQYLKKHLYAVTLVCLVYHLSELSLNIFVSSLSPRVISWKLALIFFSAPGVEPLAAVYSFQL